MWSTFHAARPSSALDVACQLSSCAANPTPTRGVANLLCRRISQLRCDCMSGEQALAAMPQVSLGCGERDVARSNCMGAHEKE